MKKIFLLTCLIACNGEIEPEPIHLTQDFYSWTCKDYLDVSEIVVSTNTCEDYETGLHWIVAEYQLINGIIGKRKLNKVDDWEDSCAWETTFPLVEEYCITVEGVSLTAYVDEPSWAGLFSK